MEEVRIDVRNQEPERIAEARRSADLCFRINQTNPTTPECQELIQELFNNTLGENTVIHPPVFTILADKVKIGKNVTILNGFQCMAAGGCCVLSDKHGMPSHWCLLAIIYRFCRCNSVPNKIFCVAFDFLKPFVFDIFKLFCAKLKSTPEFRF